MILTDVKVIRYNNIKKIATDLRISSRDKGNVPAIHFNEHAYSPTLLFSDVSNDFIVEDISSFFYFLSMLSNPQIVRELIRHQFNKEITKIELSFIYNGTEYCYMLSISEDGVHRETLFADGSITYSSNYLKPVPELPDLTKDFFSKIIYVDLLRINWVHDMIREGIDLCAQDDSFLHSISVTLKKLELTTKDLILDTKNEEDSPNVVFVYDDSTTTYISIENSNSTIRTIFALCSVIFPSLTVECLIFINDFAILDMVKKASLILLFQKIATDSSMSQMIITDSLNDLKYYGSILRDSQIVRTWQQPNGDYILSNTKV